MQTSAQRQPQPQIQPASSNLTQFPVSSLRLRQHANALPHAQPTIGNQVMGRGAGNRADGFNAAGTSSYIRHDFSRIPAYPSAGGVIRTKLAINKPGDEYEREADRVAEQVMRMPDGPVNQSAPAYSSISGSAVQRKCDKCGESEDEGLVQRSQTPGTQTVAGGSSSALAIVGEVLRSPGRPLDGATRAFMEPRFRTDFGNVRVHSDGAAATSAQAIHAHAYTVGEQIVFNRGRYAPGTDEGRHLLAHELTHVMQQRPSAAADTHSSSGDPLRRKPLAEGITGSEKGLPTLSHVTNRIQRQTPDGATGGETSGETVGSARAKDVCVAPCGSFPWFEVAPDRFMSLCNDTVNLTDPLVKTVGCPPGGSGNVVFVSGSPAWSLTNQCSDCTAPASENKPMPKVEVGYVQTVEKMLSGGVYYKRNAAGKWEWSGNEWLCVSNARDGHKTSTAPWFGPDPSGNFGPVQYPDCPSMADNPFVKLPSHKDGGTLRRMRIDGVVHLWLIAKPATGPTVFMHFWDIAVWVVTELADDGHPCSESAWNWKFNGTKVTGKGPGKGSATPALTGKTANELKQPC